MATLYWYTVNMIFGPFYPNDNFVLTNSDNDTWSLLPWWQLRTDLQWIWYLVPFTLMATLYWSTVNMILGPFYLNGNFVLTNSDYDTWSLLPWWQLCTDLQWIWYLVPFILITSWFLLCLSDQGQNWNITLRLVDRIFCIPFHDNTISTNLQ